MTVHKTAQKQYQNLVNRSASQMAKLISPNEGWVVTVRKSLGMSGAQLARRLGVTRASVSQTERKEMTGSVTIKHMQTVAEGMDCKFVYAIVPNGSPAKAIEDIIADHAEKKARALVKRASGHMGLESQSLSNKQNQQEIAFIQDDLIRTMPSDFWASVQDKY